MRPLHDLLGQVLPLVGCLQAADAYRLAPASEARRAPEVERLRPSDASSQADICAPLATASILGDSLSAGFHLSAPVETLLRLLAPGSASWFLDVRRHRRPRDLVHALGVRGFLQAHVFARAMARVVPSAKRGISSGLARATTFRRQVERWFHVAPDAPSLVCIWIGHNDLDWVQSPLVHAGSGLSAEDVRRLADQFESLYGDALIALLAHAQARRARTGIVVYGLVNFRSFFRAREMAEAQRRLNRARFPYLQHAYDYFPSMQQGYRAGMITLADAFDERIRAMVERVARGLRHGSRVSLWFSDELSRVTIDDSRLLSAWDAWHPSERGHASLADAAIRGARGCIDWLATEDPVWVADRRM